MAGSKEARLDEVYPNQFTKLISVFATPFSGAHRGDSMVSWGPREKSQWALKSSS